MHSTTDRRSKRQTDPDSSAKFPKIKQDPVKIYDVKISEK